MSIETRRTCVLSMQHLTPSTAKSLYTLPLEVWPVMGAPVGQDMLLVYVHSETDDGMPEDLVNCITWARLQTPPGSDPLRDPGYHYILFDRDKEAEEDGSDLPVYPAYSPNVFSVNVRAMAHLTQTINVAANTPEEAHRIALNLARAKNFVWDVSDPEDVQFESFN